MQGNEKISGPVGQLDTTEGAEAGKEVAYFQGAVSLALGWFCKFAWDYESRVFKVHFILGTPFPPGLQPDLSKVVKIFLGCRHHIKREPVLMGTEPGWCYWIATVAAKKFTVQRFLLRPSTQCGCDPWEHASSTAEIYKGVREWLELRNQSIEPGH